MNVQEAMEAAKDGTFEAKIKASSIAKTEASKVNPKNSVQRGRELYASLHNKKED